MLIIDSFEHKANSKGSACRLGLSFKYRCCRLSKFPVRETDSVKRGWQQKQQQQLTNFFGQS